MKIKSIILLLLICVFLLVGCAADEATQEVSSLETDAYPAADEEEGYPVTEVIVKADDSYPVSEAEADDDQGPEFHIDLPVSGGDQVVTGTGPAGVPIILVDVSEVASSLAEATIDEDGTFIFALEEPLETGHSIGLQLGDVEGTEFNESDFLYSDTYYERPLIGVLFDMATVE